MNSRLPVETSLLTGTWDARIPSDLPIPVLKLAKLVVEGDFRSALLSSQASNVFKTRAFVDISTTPLDAIFDPSFPSTTEKGGEAEWELTRLALSVACLHSFVQANWTGPNLSVAPLEVLNHNQKTPLSLTDEILNQKAISELAYGGEPAYHLAVHATFLRLAQILLSSQFEYCQSAAWWRLRTMLVHQRVLDEPVFAEDSIIAALEPFASSIAADRGLTGRLLLEQGILEHLFVHDKSATEYFVRAARATGLEYELTGALGKRTKFQKTDYSQLVLLAESHLSEKPEIPYSDDDKGSGVSAETPTINNQSLSAIIPETLPLHDDTLLEHTAFTKSAPNERVSRLVHIDPTSQPALHPLDQCILLSLCLNIKNTSPSHGLTIEQMTPYVSRVISHPRNWSVHTMALLLRSRLESHRTRTVERSTLQLQALIDQMPTADSTISERLRYFHSIPLPSRWEIERELASRFMSLGAARSALEIFERLEMWEEAVKCWQVMERSDKAIAIVRDLLEGRKEESDIILRRGKTVSYDRRRFMDASREAKLWCLLGDLEPEQAFQHYNRAWTVSRQCSGRAMRSLGSYHFTRREYSETIECLRIAVSINPLLLRSWFVLGCAYVRLESWEDARDAFSRCVAIDDEDGESWNNLASVFLRMGGREGEDREAIGAGTDAKQNDTESLEYGENTATAVSFENKMLAFRALRQGLKSSYDNWRMWSNYMIVAMDVGELGEACRALARVVEETSAHAGAKSVDEDVLERLVNAVTMAPSDATEIVGTTTEPIATNPNEGRGLLKRVLDLLEKTILPRVSSPRIFRSYARLLTWQSRWEDALKAYLDGYRSSLADKIEKGEISVEHWREAVNEVEDVIDVLRNFGPRIAGYKWRLQGRSIVRSFMGKTKEFEDETEWSKLKQLRDDLALNED